MFIIATTANKDVEIEEYIRLKDIESRSNNEFEIILYCWEDIADLIEENRNTYNYYVNQNQFKTNYDFKVYFNDFQTEIILKPKFEETIKKYRLKSQGELIRNSFSQHKTLQGFDAPHKSTSSFSRLNQDRINYAICSFEIVMANEGNAVIEDWRVSITVEEEFSKLMDSVGSGGYLGMVDLTHLKYKRTYVEGNKINYSPKDNSPLIQKDNRYFEAYIVPKGKAYRIPLKWIILARDYNSEGIIYLNIEPEVETKVIYEEVETKEEILPDEIISLKEKKSYDDTEDLDDNP